MSDDELRCDRRFKIVAIDESTLLDVFNWMSHPRGYYSLPVSEELPEGCIVLAIHFDNSRRTLNLTLTHPSFEPVPINCHIPMVNELHRLTYERLRGETDLFDISTIVDGATRLSHGDEK